MAKSIWAVVQEDPVFMRRLNGYLTLFWIAMIPISYFMGWLSSVTYVSALSLWALVSGHWSTYQAARVEVAQQAAEQRAAAEDVPAAVVDKLVKKTDINRKEE